MIFAWGLQKKYMISYFLMLQNVKLPQPPPQIFKSLSDYFFAKKESQIKTFIALKKTIENQVIYAY